MPTQTQLIFASLLILLGAFTQQCFASDCESVFSVADVEAQANSLFARAASGITDRGFIASKPGITPELGSMAGRNGLMWWGLRIYVAHSLKEAKEHSAREENSLLQGIYLIRGSVRGKAAFTPDEDITAIPAPEAFRKLVSNSPLYYIKNGKHEKIGREFVRNNLTIDEMEWSLDDPEHGPYIYQTGWAFPKERGVIIHNETLDSKTYKEVRRQARKLVAEGWRISFNRDFKQSLDKVAAQKRKIQDQWVANSRYLDPELYQATLDSHKIGRTLSVEIWNEKGELVGGLIGNREGSIFSPDSVFYDQERYPKLSIGLAKIAAMALGDRLAASGIGFVDSGMVSHFTASMKGRLIPASDFQKMIAELPKDAVVDLSSDWNP